jgi:hypothetical protein
LRPEANGNDADAVVDREIGARELQQIGWKEPNAFVLGHHGDQIEVREFFFVFVAIWNFVLDSSLLVLLLPASHRLVLGDFLWFRLCR